MSPRVRGRTHGNLCPTQGTERWDDGTEETCGDQRGEGWGKDTPHTRPLWTKEGRRCRVRTLYGTVSKGNCIVSKPNIVNSPEMTPEDCYV